MAALVAASVGALAPVDHLELVGRGITVMSIFILVDSSPCVVILRTTALSRVLLATDLLPVAVRRAHHHDLEVLGWPTLSHRPPLLVLLSLLGVAAALHVLMLLLGRRERMLRVFFILPRAFRRLLRLA